MVTSQPIAPIGTSVVQFITSDAKSPSEDPISTVVLPSKIRLPCLLMRGGNENFQSMVLNGPKSSGKTSMAMNLAYSCAGSLQCLDTAACRCAASIVFRSSTDRATSFPPTCHHFPSTDRAREVPSSYAQFQGETKGSQDDYLQRLLLQRIRIIYVDSVMQIIEELLALGKEDLSCIVVDDLDTIASRSDNSASSILQTVAAILETRNSMKTVSCAGPVILITSTSPIMAPWIEITASLRVVRSPSSWQGESFRESAPISHWRATFHSNLFTNEPDSSVDYLFINRSAGDVRIYWGGNK